MRQIIVASNRFVNADCSDHALFGSGFNQNGPCELRLAEASFNEAQGKWNLSLLPEDPSHPQDVCHASRSLFQHIVSEIRQGDSSHSRWVLFIPGYCADCEEGLNKSLELQKYHDVNVVLFSWPSDPQNPLYSPKHKYQDKQKAAIISSTALARVISGLARVLAVPARDDGNSENFRFSLLAHSLGNYVIQNYAQTDPIDTRDQIIFDNIILHQPDVDFLKHDQWINKLKCLNRIYVTTNEFDAILGQWSNLINRPRLGTAGNNIATSSNVIHVDFSGAHNVNSEHWFFGDFKNLIIKLFSTRILQGETKGEDGLYQDTKEPGRYQAYPIDQSSPLPVPE